ncbi:angiopoietin-1 receptor isoform X2 [Chanos chanos]|uniref:receptor protein-tyrosine kinase n=1 Tax=Chanos chanos TaxID=29144 RepID=A0A6J2W8U9_CHACN|nr:angiopoietin-1 receptor isoform X2 [Chanos chanos]
MYQPALCGTPVHSEPCGRGTMLHLPSALTLCLLCWLFTGNALDISDLTLVNPDTVVSSVDSTLLCVSSDWTSSGSLRLGHDFPLPGHQILNAVPDKTYRMAAKFTWNTRSDIFGAFYCRVKNSDSSKIYTYKMLNEATFRPESLTITASVHENVNISFTRRKVMEEDLVIYRNGSFVHAVPRAEIEDSLHYPIHNVLVSDAGLYTIRYIAGAMSTSAITRLIVRHCGAGLWGPDCKNECPPCANGGMCHDDTGECICPPGFKGPHCETVCGDGRFGKSCKHLCRDGQCRSMLFCLRDPYGCSCASGWRGLNCSEACPGGFYGAGCKLRCDCHENAKCDRFRGCVCVGRHGARCEKQDKAPVIVSSLRETELNSGAVYTVNCSAVGQPAALHGEIILLKPDKSTVYAVDTETVNDQTTSMFRVDKITLSDAGRWVCQTKTTAGHTEKDFIVTVRAPPQPQYPPQLNGSGPHHLDIHINNEAYTGDGPLTSVKVVYKQENTSLWETVEVSGSHVRLENLIPMTKYIVFVQLSRRGVGGTGYPGPEASFITQTQDFPLPKGLRMIPLNQTSLALSWDAVLSYVAEEWNFIVECRKRGQIEQRYYLPSSSTGHVLTNLEPRHRYECLVCLSYSLVEQRCPAVSAWTLSDEAPPPPSNILTCNITDTSAVVTWAVAEGHSISKVVIRYQVTEQVNYSQLAELAVQPEQTVMQFQLRGLRADTSYVLQLWTVNNMGESCKRPQVQLHTLIPQENPRFPDVAADGNMLFVAILGSAGMTCITILLAFCIVLQLKRASVQHRMREEPVVQFSSGTLNMPKKAKNPSQTVAYPALEWSDIKFEDVIGEGNFGQVLKARIKKDGLRMDAAIKRMKEYASKDDHRDFAGELEVLCKLGHHPNIINLLGACEHRGYLYVAIEYAPHGNLLDFLRKSRVLETDPAFAIANSTASTLSSQQLLHFAADVARGMDYLSQKQFIHRDLAARNILVGENFAAKIADFGLSRGQEVYVKKTMGRLPVRWMAIESLNYSVYTTNSDIWSYGVLLWEIVSLGGTPYCGMTCAELYEKLPQGYRLEKPLNCDDEVYELMRQCWREKPYERPSFAQILVSLNRMLEERKTYVNTTLYEKFTYAGIDCSAEEAG